MRLFSILFLAMSFSSYAQKSYTVMTFNTMCDYCNKGDHDPFETRIQYIQKTIDKHNPDLISLQEIRIADQALQILTNEKYELIFTENFIFSYADPTLAIKKEKFEVIERGQFWLGPGEGVSMGWKVAIPRQVHWVKIKDKSNKKEFYFIGSHFDNRYENLDGSSQKVQSFVENLKSPFIFAADTNIRTDSPRYDALIGNEFVNSYSLINDYKVTDESYKMHELCYKKGGKNFPGCAVDHVLLSKSNEWTVQNWTIDVTKFGKNKTFASDHRAIIVELTLN